MADTRYMLDVALDHVHATRPNVTVTDLVMHPDLAESRAGGCEFVAAWCALHGITPHLVTWAPRNDFVLGDLAPTRINDDDSLHVSWIEPFAFEPWRRFVQ
jgi:hypothetical protein